MFALTFLLQYWWRRLREDHTWLSVLVPPLEQRLLITRSQRVLVLCVSILGNFAVAAAFLNVLPNTASQVVVNAIINNLFMIPFEGLLPDMFKYANTYESLTVAVRNAVEAKHKGRRRHIRCMALVSRLWFYLFNKPFPGYHGYSKTTVGDVAQKISSKYRKESTSSASFSRRDSQAAGPSTAKTAPPLPSLIPLKKGGKDKVVPINTTVADASGGSMVTPVTTKAVSLQPSSVASSDVDNKKLFESRFLEDNTTFMHKTRVSSKEDGDEDAPRQWNQRETQLCNISDPEDEIEEDDSEEVVRQDALRVAQAHAAARYTFATTKQGISSASATRAPRKSAEEWEAQTPIEPFSAPLFGAVNGDGGEDAEEATRPHPHALNVGQLFTVLSGEGRGASKQQQQQQQPLSSKVAPRNAFAALVPLRTQDNSVAGNATPSIPTTPSSALQAEKVKYMLRWAMVSMLMALQCFAGLFVCAIGTYILTNNSVNDATSWADVGAGTVIFGLCLAGFTFVQRARFVPAVIILVMGLLIEAAVVTSFLLYESSGSGFIAALVLVGVHVFGIVAAVACGMLVVITKKRAFRAKLEKFLLLQRLDHHIFNSRHLSAIGEKQAASSTITRALRYDRGSLAVTCFGGALQQQLDVPCGTSACCCCCCCGGGVAFMSFVFEMRSWRAIGVRFSSRWNHV